MSKLKKWTTICYIAKNAVIQISCCIDYLKRQQEEGCQLILWTCRTNKELDDAVAWCKEQGLEFDAVNQNTKESIEIFGEDTRKVFAHEYIDDHNAILSFC